MLISIKPESIIEFEFSPLCTVTSTLSIKNIVDFSIAFKVKTTAPKSYVVKPNQGILSPDEGKDLTVIMQPLQEYPGKVNHRFLVQAAPTTLSPDQIEELTKFWGENPEKSISIKLSVIISDINKYQTSSSYQSINSESNVDKSEIMKNEIKDLREFHDKQSGIKKKLEDENMKLIERQKSRDSEINKMEIEGLKGYGSLHLMLVCLLGILVGYLYAIGKS